MTPLFLLSIMFLFIYTNDGVNAILPIGIEFIKVSDIKWNGIGLPIFIGVCFFLVSYIFYNDYLISFRSKRIIITDNSVLDIEIQLSRDYTYMLTSFLIAKNVCVPDNYGKND